MGRNWLILTFFVIGGILMFGFGCQELSESMLVPEVPAAPNEPAVVTAKAQEPEKTAPRVVETKPPPDVKALTPIIRFDKVIHDFGEIGPGSSNTCEFVITNAGEGLLKITDVKAPCDCTIVKLEKKLYAPGESGKLKIRYNAGRQAAQTRKYVYVSSNDKARPKVTLTMKATIVMKVAFEPKRFNLLLKDEEEALPKITLRSLDDRPFSIKSIMSTVSAITASFDSSVEATKFVLQPRVDKSRLRRVTSGVIEVNLTHPECKQIRIPFSALTRFKVNPVLLYITAAQPGKTVKRDVWVLNNYEEDFEVESAKSKAGIIKVLSQEKINNGYKFSLEITPPDSGGKMRFADEFLVRIKGGELLRVNCQGFYLRKKASPK